MAGLAQALLSVLGAWAGLLVSGTGVALYVRGAELATGGAGTATWIWGPGWPFGFRGTHFPKEGSIGRLAELGRGEGHWTKSVRGA